MKAQKVSHVNDVFLFALAVALVVPSIGEQLLGVPPKYSWVGVLVYVGWIAYIGVFRGMLVLPDRNPQLARVEQMRSWVLLAGLPFIFVGNLIPHLLGLDTNLSNLPIAVLVIMLPFYGILYLITFRVPSLVFLEVIRHYKTDQKEWLRWRVLLPTASTTFGISIIGIQLGILMTAPIDAASVVASFLIVGILGWRVLVNEHLARQGSAQLVENIQNPKNRLPKFGIRRPAF